jgi:AraC-type DNA-binding domain-containing proteins
LYNNYNVLVDNWLKLSNVLSDFCSAGEVKMAEAFKNFLDQIPSAIRSETEASFDRNMIIFRPVSYIIGLETYFEDYHFVLTTSDPPPLRVEQRVHQFKKGKLLPFTPETRMLCTESAPTRQYIALNIKKDFLQGIAQEVVGKADVLFTRMNNPYSTQLVNLICSFEEEVKNYQHNSPLMLQSISTQIVIQLLRETGSNSMIGEKLPLDCKYVNIAKEYIMAYYNANIKIADICEEIHLSPYYFIRVFKEQTGQSPHEFLLSIRMSKAEELLQKGDYTIEEVARLCGFVNIAHFSNQFKRIKGVPPSVYKRDYLRIKR